MSAPDIHLKMVEGEPCEMLSRGFLKTDVRGHDAVLVYRKGTDLAHLGALLIREDYERNRQAGEGDE